MDTLTSPRQPKQYLRVALTPEAAQALAGRAARNDRPVWLEATRIVRERLLQDGDLRDEANK